MIQIDSMYFRPAEVDLFWGDPSKAKRELGWQLKTSFDHLFDMMTDADYEMTERGNK